MSLASINPTNPKTNPWNFHDFFWELAVLKVSVYNKRVTVRNNLLHIVHTLVLHTWFGDGFVNNFIFVWDNNYFWVSGKMIVSSEEMILYVYFL